MQHLTVRVLVCGLTALAIFGCGRATGTGSGGSPGAQVADPATDLAQSVKSMVHELQRGFTDEGVASVEGNLDSFLESMESLDSTSIGEHKATYDQLLSLAKELKPMLSANPNPANIQAKIQAMTDAAGKLPGTITE